MAEKQLIACLGFYQPFLSIVRLTWQGSIEAQRLAEAAVVPAKKKKKRRRKKPHKKFAAAGMPYRKYLRSSHWRKRRKLAIEKANFRCEKCGVSEDLRVHHLSYKRLWREWDEDLVVLCDPCHCKVHNIMARKIPS